MPAVKFKPKPEQKSKKTRNRKKQKAGPPKLLFFQKYI
jgi:hypothetical protein